jgi:hypothetical protein
MSPREGGEAVVLTTVDTNLIDLDPRHPPNPPPRASPSWPPGAPGREAQLTSLLLPLARTPDVDACVPAFAAATRGLPPEALGRVCRDASLRPLRRTALRAGEQVRGWGGGEVVPGRTLVRAMLPPRAACACARMRVLLHKHRLLCVNSGSQVPGLRPCALTHSSTAVCVRGCARAVDGTA